MSIPELIKEGLLWVISLFLDRQPELDEAIRLVVLIASTVAISWLALSWQSIALRVRPIRAWIEPNERYAGRYLLAVLDENEVRYSIVHIHYDFGKRRYVLDGRYYFADGTKRTHIRSDYISFPDEDEQAIEYVWQGKRYQDIKTIEGYVRMDCDLREHNYCEGDGFVMNFENPPTIKFFQFKFLRDDMVLEALGVETPSSNAEEPNFVRRFHAKFGPVIAPGLKARKEPEAAPALQTETV